MISSIFHQNSPRIATTAKLQNKNMKCRLICKVLKTGHDKTLLNGCHFNKLHLQVANENLIVASYHLTQGLTLQ